MGKGIKGIGLINHPYKLLVVDIDGTLIARNRNALLDEDKEALAKAGDLGIKVSLSTGRSPVTSLKIIDQLLLNGYHIFFDGALVSNPNEGEEVYIQPINKAVGMEAVEFAHEHAINLELFSTTRYFSERETWVSEVRRKNWGIESTIMDFTDIWEREKIIKAAIVVCSPEERAKADSFHLQFSDKLNFYYWTPVLSGTSIDFISIVAPEVSKGEALKALASHLGISLNEVMAIGDSTNDIPLLSIAGLSIAMGNALDEVKAVTGHVTLDIDHGGVAAAIKKFLL